MADAIKKFYGYEEVRRRMLLDIRKLGSQAAYAEMVATSRSMVSMVMSGRKRPGPKVLKAVGLRRVVVYEEA